MFQYISYVDVSNKQCLVIDVFVHQCVCNHLDIEPGDRLSLDSKKRKFLIRSMPNETVSKTLFCFRSNFGN